MTLRLTKRVLTPSGKGTIIDVEALRFGERWGVKLDSTGKLEWYFAEELKYLDGSPIVKKTAKRFTYNTSSVSSNNTLNGNTSELS